MKRVQKVLDKAGKARSRVASKARQTGGKPVGLVFVWYSDHPDHSLRYMIRTLVLYLYRVLQTKKDDNIIRLTSQVLDDMNVNMM